MPDVPVNASSRLLMVIDRIVRDRWVQVLLIFAFLLVVLEPTLIGQLKDLVEWKTVGAISGLLALAKTLELSGYLAIGSRHILYHCHTERRLALTLILLSAVLSAWITNDVALFIIVPLTLSAARHSSLPVARLVIFEALAVNAGSSITAIGNPQNLFLWRISGDSLLEFSLRMAPASLLMMGVVVVLAVVAFSSRRLEIEEAPDPEQRSKMLVASGGTLYIVFIAAMDTNHTISGLALVLVAVMVLSAVSGRRILSKLDWGLVFAFILMFIDFRGLTQLPFIHHVLHMLPLNSVQGSFWVAALGSQVISNVPATITLAGFTQQWSALAYGVNVGGFGLAIGSLANLIALRQVSSPGLWLLFHRYSLIAWFLGAMATSLLLCLQFR